MIRNILITLAVKLLKGFPREHSKGVCVSALHPEPLNLRFFIFSPQIMPDEHPPDATAETFLGNPKGLSITKCARFTMVRENR